MSANQHGGKREGAGRPPIASPRVKLTVRVHPDTLANMNRLRVRKGLCLGRWLDETVRWLMEPMK